MYMIFWKISEQLKIIPIVYCIRSLIVKRKVEIMIYYCTKITTLPQSHNERSCR